MQEIEKHGFAPVDNPVRELAKLAGEALAMKNFVMRSATSAEIAGPEARAYERWLDRLDRMLTSMARLNIEDRARQLAERDARILIAAMTILVTELGHDVSDTATRELIARAFQEAQARYVAVAR